MLRHEHCYVVFLYQPIYNVYKVLISLMNIALAQESVNEKKPKFGKLQLDSHC